MGRVRLGKGCTDCVLHPVRLELPAWGAWVLTGEYPGTLTREILRGEARSAADALEEAGLLWGDILPGRRTALGKTRGIYSAPH